MSHSNRFQSILVIIFTALILILPMVSTAQYSNPYRALYDWAKLPDDRPLGVVAGIYQQPEGQQSSLLP